MPGNGADTQAKGYAIETRAETLNVRTGGDSIRRGERDELRTGNVERLEDAVYGEENVTVSGELAESVGQGSTLAADTLGFTVNGRLSISAIGWPENKLSGEDAVLLGGAMAETWTGGTLIAAAMSDDLIVGGGVRITAPLDVSMNNLTGIQERPGTGAADVVFRELYGTLFEREYGPGTHSASVASFTGTVYQTQRAGFRPLMKTALGVRNLIPGGAPGVAPEPSPPAPPAAPPSAGPGAGAMVAANMGAGAVGTARGAENFQDMGRVAGAAEDMQNVAALHHADDTADTLDELANAARLGDPDVPEGAVNQGMPPMETTGQLNIDGPYGQVDDLDNPYGPIDDIDEPLAELMNPIARTDVDQNVSDLQLEFFAALDESAAGGSDSLNATDAGRLLDVDAENLVDQRLGGFDGSQLDSTHIESSASESSAVSAPSAAPSLDDSGAGWSIVGSSTETSPGAAVDASSPAQPNYQHMPSRESGVSPGSGASSGDAQAVADASVYRRAPDDFDCIGTQVELEKVYYEHREASNWRGLEAYGVVNDLREDMRIFVSNVGGEVGEGRLETLYSEIRRARAAAVESGNTARVQSIDAFFDWYDLKVYDVAEDLTHRVDEFNDVLTGAGGVRMLDSDVDRAKLQQWLLEQSNDAFLRIQDTTGMDDSEIRALGREGPYFYQMWLAVEEGRDPLVESLDEIAYLRSVNNQEQVREYFKHHRRLLAAIADPELHIGDAAQTADLLRPGLESTDGGLPVIGDRLRTNVLDAELTEPSFAQSLGGTTEAAAGDFGANHQVLAGLAGAGDLARPPASQPHWMGSVPLRKILFPTGDPGFEHLLEGVLTSGGIADTVESSVTAAEDDDELLSARDLASPDSGFLGPPRFGDVPVPSRTSPLLPGTHWSHGYRNPRFGQHRKTTSVPKSDAP